MTHLRHDGMRLVALCSLLGTLAVAPLGAQGARPAAVTLPAPPVSAAAVEVQLAAIADAGVRANLGALIAESTRRGLPADPLVTKALEGIEKGAPPARIEAAVRAMAGRLVTASQALAPVLTLTDLHAGADALGAGVPADVLRRVREVAGGRPIAVPVGVVAQLTARGVPAARAGAAVAVLLRYGAGNGQLLALQQQVQEDLAVGIPPTNSLDLRMQALTSTLPPPIAPGTAAPSAGDFTTQQIGAPRSTTPRKKP